MNDRLRGLVPEAFSYDALCGVDGDGETYDTRDAVLAVPPPQDEVIVRATRWQRLRPLLKKLTERERFVVVARYGLDPDVGELTLEETGCLLGISRERVRQLEEDALARMRGLVSERRGTGRVCVQCRQTLDNTQFWTVRDPACRTCRGPGRPLIEADCPRCGRPCAAFRPVLCRACRKDDERKRRIERYRIACDARRAGTAAVTSE